MWIRTIENKWHHVAQASALAAYAVLQKSMATQELPYPDIPCLIYSDGEESCRAGELLAMQQGGQIHAPSATPVYRFITGLHVRTAGNRQLKYHVTNAEQALAKLYANWSTVPPAVVAEDYLGKPGKVIALWDGQTLLEHPYEIAVRYPFWLVKHQLEPDMFGLPSPGTLQLLHILTASGWIEPIPASTPFQAYKLLSSAHGEQEIPCVIFEDSGNGPGRVLAFQYGGRFRSPADHHLLPAVFEALNLQRRFMQ